MLKVLVVNHRIDDQLAKPGIRPSPADRTLTTDNQLTAQLNALAGRGRRAKHHNTSVLTFSSICEGIPVVSPFAGFVLVPDDYAFLRHLGACVMEDEAVEFTEDVAFAVNFSLVVDWWTGDCMHGMSSPACVRSRIEGNLGRSICFDFI